MKKQITNDQSQVNTDKQNISSTQSSIKSDQDNIKKDQQAINNVGQKAQQDQQKLNDDQGKLNDAQNKLNNDQKQLDDTNKQINNLQNQNQNYPEIYVTQSGKEYLKALSNGETSSVNGNTGAYGKYLKDHELDGSDFNAGTDEASREAIFNKYYDLQNTYSVKFPYSKLSKGHKDPVSGQPLLDTADNGSMVLDNNHLATWIDGHNGGYYSKSDDYAVDPTNLTADQMKEINIFATELINEFRACVGIAPLKLTQPIIDEAIKVSQIYNNDNWSMIQKDYNHDHRALTDTLFDAEDACPGNLSQESLKDDDNFVNKNGGNSHLATHFTMNNLKTAVADAIMQLLYTNDGHAQMLMDKGNGGIGVSI